jgi:hypothetical protein
LGVRRVLAVAVVFAALPVQGALAAAPSVSVTASKAVGCAAHHHADGFRRRGLNT